MSSRSIGVTKVRCRRLRTSCEISNIENKADGAYTTGVGSLFEEEKDPIQVIKWKEILDMLEGATDRCKDVAKVLEAVYVKHS